MNVQDSLTYAATSIGDMQLFFTYVLVELGLRSPVAAFSEISLD